MSIRENRGRGRREDAPRRREEEPATVYRPRTLRSRRSDTPHGEQADGYGYDDATASAARPREEYSERAEAPLPREHYDDSDRHDRRRDGREDNGNGRFEHGNGRFEHDRPHGFERGRRRAFDDDRGEDRWGQWEFHRAPRGRFDGDGERGRYGAEERRERFDGGREEGRFRSPRGGRDARDGYERRGGGYGRDAPRVGDRRFEEGSYGRGGGRYGREEESAYRPRTSRYGSAPERRGGARRGDFEREDSRFSRGREGSEWRERRYGEGRFDRPPRRRRETDFGSPRWQSVDAMAERAAQRQSAQKVQPRMPQTVDPNEPMRLNRYIAHSGMCSRREADEMIARGDIMVNGEVVTALGSKVIPAQAEVTCRGKKLDPERKVYILLNKPKDCFSTTDDPHAGRTVLDAVEGACRERIYPVGRLDRNSTGLLLLTNDGALTEQLTHPSYEKRKVYEVAVDRNVSREEMQRLLDGIELDEGTVRADAVEYAKADRRDVLGIEIHSGQNRVVRRMLDALGLRVQSLDRVYYAGLTKKDLPRGQWRFLTPLEVANLKSGRYE